jgi:hypothetical protein
MVYRVNDPQDKAFSLAEYIEFVRSNIDTSDFDSMCDNSWSLRALANDRAFLLDVYHQELKRWWSDADRQTMFHTQSMFLHVDRKFALRSNIWPPLTKEFEGDEGIYAYGVPHNHNYHFSTVGYFGPGYPTRLCRCETPPYGYVGEKVNLTKFRMETLAPGTVMVYEAFRDVHVQAAPQAFSVTINLLSLDPKMDTQPQCIIDMDRGKVLGSVGTPVSRRLFAVSLLRYLNDDTSIELLSALATSDCVRTGALALNILKELRPEEFERAFSRAPQTARELWPKPLTIGDDFMRFAPRSGGETA